MGLVMGLHPLRIIFFNDYYKVNPISQWGEILVTVNGACSWYNRAIFFEILYSFLAFDF